MLLNKFIFKVLVSFLTSLSIVIVLGNPLQKILKYLKIKDNIRCKDVIGLEDKFSSKNNIPTMGGILIILANVASILFWADLSHIYSWILISANLVIGSIGFVDDIKKMIKKDSKGLRGRHKILVQVCFALLVALYICTFKISKNDINRSDQQNHFSQYESNTTKLLSKNTSEQKTDTIPCYIPFIKTINLSNVVFVKCLLGLLIVFVIVGSSNATNLSDGLDGLASSLCLVAAFTMGIFAIVASPSIADTLVGQLIVVEGAENVAIALFSLVGACVGFLWYNGFPASIFMGDTGALSIGAVLGVSAVLMRQEFIYAIVGGLFVAEALSVIIQVRWYKLTKKRIFLCAPIHHHFQMKGLEENKIVIRFIIVACLLSLVVYLDLFVW